MIEATSVLSVDDSTEDLLRTWTKVTHTLVSTGYAPYLYQTLETASIIRDPAYDDLVLRNFLKDLTVTVNPAILSSCQCTSAFDCQSSPDPEGSLAPGSCVVDSGVPESCNWVIDAPSSAEFTTSDGHLLGIPGFTRPGGRCNMLNNDVQDMPAISGPGESYFDELYESSLFDLGQVFSPSPMSTNLQEQSTPNRDCDGSYTAEHNTECLSDTGPPRPIAVTKSSQKIAKSTKNQRTRMGRKRTPGSSAKPRRSDVQVLESV
jgi:hypothetical protein